MEALSWSSRRKPTWLTRQTVTGTALVIALAGLLHMYAAYGHLDHPGHALFLLLAGLIEVVWGLAFWRRPSTVLGRAGILLAGSLVLLWALTRVVPAPFGHGPGEIDSLGVLSKIAEAIGLAGLLTMFFLGSQTGAVRWSLWRTMLVLLGLAVCGALLLYGAGLVAEWALPWLAEQDDHATEVGGIRNNSLGTNAALAPVPFATGLSSVDMLWRQLTRSGLDPTPGTALEVTYAPPVLFQAMGQETLQQLPNESVAVFLVLESNEDHHAGFPPDPIPALLQLDNNDAFGPLESAILYEDGHGHRRSRLVFALPPGTDAERFLHERHILRLIVPREGQGSSVFTWAFPITALEPPSESTPREALAPFSSLTKTRDGLTYGGRSDITVEATYVTPEFLRRALPPDAQTHFPSDRFLTFLVSERVHNGDLPPASLTVSLRFDGRDYQPDLVELLTTAPHHRATLVRFPVMPPPPLEHHVLELRLSGGASLTWHLPVAPTGDAAPTPGFRLTWVSVLALLAGLVAAMWPCLFQLTVFFIPALAGLSMQEASGEVTLRQRFQVVKVAFLFVLGFTLTYTVSGALLGLAAQRLGEAPDFSVWQRYAAIGGGIAIIILALRVAVRVRAPLVCKMPILSRMAHQQKPTSALEVMFAGLAFATGCMTCFGAAILIAMVVYVGLSGSPVIGALTMFLFSLGMGIPLVLGAIAMAKILPVLSRLERLVPWLGLASSILMIGFALLLITGNYMALTAWVYRLL